MGERESRVVYRTRTLDRDEERPPVPTAFDPYKNPSVLESPSRRKSSVRHGMKDSSSALGNNSRATEKVRSTTRTSYSVRDDDRSGDVYTDTRKSSREDYPPENVSVRRSVASAQRRDGPQSRLPPSVIESRVTRDRDHVDSSIERPRGRSRDYYVDDRPRPMGGPYVIETRPGDIIDISFAGRERDRADGRGMQRYAYDDGRSSRTVYYDRDYDRRTYARSIDDVRGASTASRNTEYSQARTKRPYDDDRPSSRPPPREDEYSREDDWRLVDSMRDTRIGSVQSRDDYPERSGRSRAQTHDSEDSYVMVSPTQASRPRAASRARSAIARTDYSGPELHRRRSRSISFRDSQIHHHDASERKHERPGAEAQICGPYLRRPVSDYDSQVDTYASYHELDRRSRIAESDQYSATYRERDEPYGPQVGHEPRRRDRSRRRRRDEDYDDDSHYSETVTKKTNRETSYR